jgi:hypothetical protein
MAQLVCSGHSCPLLPVTIDYDLWFITKHAAVNIQRDAYTEY